MAEFIGHEPCPKCGSGDNLARYSDGSAHCFSPGCKHFEKATTGKPMTTHAKPKAASRPLFSTPDTPHPVPSKFARGISQKTFKRFGTFHHTVNKKDVLITPYYNQDGLPAYQKLRFIDEKDFAVITAPGETANFKTAWLLGRAQYGDSLFRRVETSNVRSRVVIVEGEVDQHHTAEIFANDKFTAVVSPPSGADSAKASIAANAEWLAKFDRIYLALDDDDHGRTAMEECAPYLPEDRLYVVRWGPRKDPNAIATSKDGPGEVYRKVETASRWVRPGTITGSALYDVPTQEAEEDTTPAFAWPWPKLQAATETAIRRGDLVVILGPIGRGKTTLLYEVGAKALAEGKRVGAMLMENTPNEAINGFLTATLSKPLTSKPGLMEPIRRRDAMIERSWGDSLFIEDNQKIPTTPEGLYSKIQYLAGVCNVDILCIDPLSVFIAKAIKGSDTVQAIDEVMLRLSELARNLKITLLCTQHLSRPEGNLGHEEGAEISIKHARGSQGIAQFAQNVIAYQPPNKRNGETASRIVWKKARWLGQLSETIATYLAYDPDTGRVVEVNDAKGGIMPDDMFTDVEGYDNGF